MVEIGAHVDNETLRASAAYEHRIRRNFSAFAGASIERALDRTGVTYALDGGLRWRF